MTGVPKHRITTIGLHWRRGASRSASIGAGEVTLGTQGNMPEWDADRCAGNGLDIANATNRSNHCIANCQWPNCQLMIAGGAHRR